MSGAKNKHSLWCDRRCRCACAVSFGLGISVSFFCPVGLTLFLCAVIMVALGITLLRH